MLCNLLHAKLVWMLSVCYIPNYYMLNWVYLYLEPILLNRIGKLLGYLAALSVNCVYRLLSLRGWVDSAWDSKSLDCSRSQLRILQVAEFFDNSRLISTFLISLDWAAFWSCSRKCLPSAASPLCKIEVYTCCNCNPQSKCTCFLNFRRPCFGANKCWVF